MVEVFGLVIVAMIVLVVGAVVLFFMCMCIIAACGLAYVLVIGACAFFGNIFTTS